MVDFWTTESTLAGVPECLQKYCRPFMPRAVLEKLPQVRFLYPRVTGGTNGAKLMDNLLDEMWIADCGWASTTGKIGKSHCVFYTCGTCGVFATASVADKF